MPKVSKPAPFQRNSISLTDVTKREWLEVPAARLTFGDLIPDYGYIEKVTSFYDFSSGTNKVGFEFSSGKRDVFAVEQKVRAFTRG